MHRALCSPLKLASTVKVRSFPLKLTKHVGPLSQNQVFPCSAQKNVLFHVSGINLTYKKCWSVKPKSNSQRKKLFWGTKTTYIDPCSQINVFLWSTQEMCRYVAPKLNTSLLKPFPFIWKDSWHFANYKPCVPQIHEIFQILKNKFLQSTQFVLQMIYFSDTRLHKLSYVILWGKTYHKHCYL